MFNFLDRFLVEKRSFGLLAPDIKDNRDYLLSDIQAERAILPEEYDLRESGYMIVQSQRNLGICYSFGAGGVKEFLDSREAGKQINLSERFIVHYTKTISGLWDQHGDYFRNALQALCKYGAPLESSYPNNFCLSWEKFSKEEPSEEVKKEALEYRGKTYWRVSGDLESIRQAIFQQKCPVMTGMMWNKAYKPDSSGKLPLPEKGKDSCGHAVSAVGWTKDKLWFKNSWGENFGANGYFYIPFNEFDKHQIWDNYVLIDMEKSIGWTAGEYLKHCNEFKKGDTVEVIAKEGLNLRETPGLKGRKIEKMKLGTKLEILENKSTSANNYIWYKVKIK